MGLTEYRLGDLIELRIIENVDLKYGPDDVRGVNNLKQLMSTKADISDRDLTKFQIVAPREFVFNHRTSRNGSKFSIAYNDTDAPIICTEDYVVFRIKPECEEIILARWLYMYFNRLEFDRYVIMNSWGSSTEFYNWEDICGVRLYLPSFPVQQKYVDVYEAMLKNQQSYERGLEDLRLACEAYIEKLRREVPAQKIRSKIAICEQKNDDLRYGIADVRGVSIEKKLIETKADMMGVGLAPYYVIPSDAFVYVPVTSRNGGKISIAYNDFANPFICSAAYIVFRSLDVNELLPAYLNIFLNRSEFDRYARFHSWGSARETFDWEEMCDVEIPIPDIKVQHAIAEFFTAYNTRKKINEQLKGQIRDICPILIKGSLEEGES